MKPGFWDCVRAAFNARPIGMLVAPNWIGLGAFALLGLINPGFLMLGAGLELGYLYSLSTNRRFQSVVQGVHLSRARREWQQRQASQVAQLSPADQEQYQALYRRCQTILSQQRGPGAGTELDLQAQGEGLGRLLWIYLQLLLTRQGINRVLRDSGRGDAGRQTLEGRCEELQERLKDQSIGEELRKSLSAQQEILQQRLAKQQEARDKLDYVEAELTRIREQAELIREQAALTADPEAVSQRIDQIAATLGGTSQWIQDQRRIYGKVEDLLSEPPPVVLETPTEESP